MSMVIGHLSNESASVGAAHGAERSKRPKRGPARRLFPTRWAGLAAYSAPLRARLRLSFPRRRPTVAQSLVRQMRRRRARHPALDRGGRGLAAPDALDPIRQVQQLPVRGVVEVSPVVLRLLAQDQLVRLRLLAPQLRG